MRRQVAQFSQDTSHQHSQDEIQQCIIAAKLCCFDGEAAGPLKLVGERRASCV